MWGKPVAYQIPISLLGKELDGKTSRITSSICRPLFSANSRESNEDGSLLADFVEKVGERQVGDIIRDLKHTMRTSTLGMYNTIICQSQKIK